MKGWGGAVRSREGELYEGGWRRERERERRRGRTVRLASFRFFLSIHSVRPYSGAEHNGHIGEGKGQKIHWGGRISRKITYYQASLASTITSYSFRRGVWKFPSRGETLPLLWGWTAVAEFHSWRQEESWEDRLDSLAVELVARTRRDPTVPRSVAHTRIFQ